MEKLKKVNIEDILALTPMQEGMLFHYLKDPGSDYYFEQLSLEISGNINKEIFEKSLNFVIETNEMLRTVFRWEKVDSPVQIILRENSLQPRYYDFSPGASHEIQKRLEQVKVKDRKEKFDLREVPFRVTLCKVGEDKYEMIISNHHILYDGWSNGILLEEFLGTYNHLSNGKKFSKPPKTKFREFIRMTRNRDVYKEEQFWKNYLRDPVAPGEFFIKKSKKNGITHTGAFQLKLEKPGKDRFEHFVKKSKITLACLLFSSWGLLLSRYGNREEVIFGTTVSGRSINLKGIEDMVGLFINTVPLRIKFPADEKVSHLLARVHTVLRQRENHLGTPLVKIKEYSGIPGQEELFNTVVVMENYPLESLLKQEKSAASLSVDSFVMEESIHYDLIVSIKWFACIEIKLLYNSRLFEKKNIVRMSRHFTTLLEQLAEGVDKNILALEMLSVREKSRLLVNFNDTGRDYPRYKLLHQLFAQQAEKNPHHIALVGPGTDNHGQQHLSYGELNIQSHQLAEILKVKGTGVESIVALRLRRSIEMILAILGVLKAGAAYLPINPGYPEERVRFMLADSGTNLLVTGGIGYTSDKEIKKLKNWQGEEIFLGRRPPPACPVKASDRSLLYPPGAGLAYVIFTSGSTGKPKGVLIAHQSVHNLVIGLREIVYQHYGTPLKVCLVAPFEFDASVQQIFAALLQGHTLYIVTEYTRMDGFGLLAFYKKYQVDISDGTPSHIGLLVEAMEMKKTPPVLPVKYFIIAGEVFPKNLAMRLLENLKMSRSRVSNLYGPTETCVDSTFFQVSTGMANVLESIPIGKPLANQQVYILDRENQLLSLDLPGELCIGGDGTARGYLNRPELTAGKFIRAAISYSSIVIGRSSKTGKKFSKISNDRYPMTNDRFYRTGDLARWLRDGNIEFLGRMDTQVKIRGYRVELEEIKNLLLKHRDVKDAAVIARQGKHTGNDLYAFIVSDKDAPLSGIEAYLAGELPPYMIPAYFAVIRKIPLTANGKTDMKALQIIAASGVQPLGTGTGYAAPQNHIEKIIAGIWKEILGIDKVGINDNFFDIGGNSLLMMRLNSRLVKVLQKDISMVTLFNYPNISSLGRHLQGAEKEREDFPWIKTGQGNEPGKGIAVIGMACRFPGAKNSDEFWENIKRGVESIRFFSHGELEAMGIDAAFYDDPNYVKAKGVLENIEYFDAVFFGYTPREARLMDPQLRLLHECAWEAMENAGYVPGSYNGRIGVVVGSLSNFWWMQRLAHQRGNFSDLLAVGSLNDRDYLATRISYKLNLKGPAVTVQSACSTSLVAIDAACQAINAGKCQMVLAGGVSVSLHDRGGYLYQEGMILSPDGHCRAFDARARGTVGGNGVGIVVLKSLFRAAADGDNILALVKSSATNNDGSRKAGYTAPSVDGQAEAIRAALTGAGIDPGSVTYLETHGTGTILGDPIEIRALKKAFSTNKKGFCAIGSVKTNLGHLDAAAGVAGFIKTVLALKYKFIPPTINFDTPNPQIDFINSPFYVNTTLRPWERNKGPLRAGVSSFGLGGTNAHVILEEATLPTQDKESTQFSETHQLILLSARTPTVLEQMSKNLADYFKKNRLNREKSDNRAAPGLSLADAAYTLQVGRKAFQYRKMFVCSGIDEAIALLTAGENKKVQTGVLNEKEVHDVPGTFADWQADPINKDTPRELLLKELGGQWLQGGVISREQVWGKEKRRRIALPTYPFQGQSFSLDPGPLPFTGTEPLHGRSLKKKPAMVDWFYAPAWKPSALPFPGSEETLLLKLPSPCLIFFHDMTGGLGQLLKKRLQAVGKKVFCVKPGGEFKKENDYLYTVNPGKNDDYDRLFTELTGDGEIPRLILHLWGVTGPENNKSLFDRLEQGRDTGFYSLLYIARAIGRLDLSWKDRLSLLVVTDHMQKLPGEEELMAEKALTLGAVKVIPQEYPFIRCRGIDIKGYPADPGKQERIYRELLAEMAGGDDKHQVIAWRGHGRWVQTYEPVRITGAGPICHRLRPRGCYLITGGYGGIGLEIARFLAKNFQARLVLTGLRPFPPPEEWHKWLSGELTAHRPIFAEAARQARELYRLENELYKTYGIRGVKNRKELEKFTSEFCGALIYEYFKQSSIHTGKGQTHHTPDLMEQLKILPRFRKFFDFFIRVLEEDGFIRLRGQQVEFLGKGDNLDISRLREEARNRFPGFKGTFELLRYCASRFPQALSGEIEAISVLFPNNQPLHLQERYRDQEETSTRIIYCRLLQELVYKLLTAPGRPREKINILEIGAGTGTLTRLIAPGLRGGRVRYYFTDIGNYFLLNARKEDMFKGLPHMVFKRLDIATDPLEQGFKPHFFDMILGLNVVHATPGIAETLGHLKKLLAPGGMLVLVETVRAYRWFNMIDGLAEGWWYFRDDGLRKESPLMDMGQWHQCFLKQGFQDILLFPGPGDKEKQWNSDTGLIIAGQDPAIPDGNRDEETRKIKNKIRTLKEIKDLGAEVLLECADVTNLDQMRAVVERARKTFNEINGVIHCAGRLDYAGLIQQRDGEATREILAPKVAGTLVLDRVFKEISLDFFVLFSSLSSIVPPVGQVGHCAANAFLDAFAHYRTAVKDQFTLSINWEAWKEVGSAQEVSEQWNKDYDFLDYSISDFALPPAEGVKIFKRCLGSTLPQVVISTRDLPGLLARDRVYGEPAPWEGGEESGTGPVGTASNRKPRRTDLSAPYAAPRNKTQQTLALLWQDFFDIQRVGIHDDFFELGLDSLMAINLAIKIHKALHVQVPIPVIFNRPTIEGIARYIETAGKDEYEPPRATEKKEYYVLSSAQKRIYILDRMIPGSTAYNETSLWTVGGELDKQRLEQAFKKLIQRHESFRTAIVLLGDEPFQCVHDRVEFNIHHRVNESLRAADPDCAGSRQELPGAGIIGDFIRPFNLFQAPLLRVELVEHGPKKYLLMVDMHHMITDGISYGILAGDLLQLYGGGELPALSFQYKDFARWRHDQGQKEKEKEILKKQESYWLEVFPGEIPVLNLPTDYARPAVQHFEGDSIRFKIGKEEANALGNLAVEKGTTLFMLLLAIYNVWAARLSSQEDITVGTPAAGRRHADMENIIGMFVNTLGLRNYPRGDFPFEIFLEQVKKRTTEAFDNQDYPYEELVEKIAVRRDTSRNPMFDIMFVLQNWHNPEMSAHGLNLIPHDFSRGKSKFDITLECFDQGETLLCHIEYSTKLFKRETVLRFGDYFKRLLALAIERPGLKLAEMEIITPGEKKRILNDFNRTASDYPREKTIIEEIETQVFRGPHGTAAVLGNHQLSYRGLRERYGLLAVRLVALGVGADKIVALMTERSLEMLIAIIAILKAGGAYLPIDPYYPHPRKEYILNESGTPWLLLQKKFEPFQGNVCQTLILDDPLLYDLEVKGEPGKVNNPGNLAYVIYTSGSTGKPKGVMINHYSLVNRLNWMRKHYQIDKGDIILHKTPYTFDVSLWELFGWGIAGARVCLLVPGGEKDPQVTVDAIHRHQVTIMHFVPSMLKVFLEFLKDSGAQDKLSGMRLLIASGEVLPLSLVEEFFHLFTHIALANLYGPTEATVDVSYFDCPVKTSRDFIPIGKPIDNIRLFIINIYLHLQPVGVPGELCIAGAGLARGYLNKPELITRSFCRGGRILHGAGFLKHPPLDVGRPKDSHSRFFYRTGDLARWLAQGSIQFLGRMDGQVKIRGIRIETGEIEHRLLGYHGVSQGVVKEVENREGDKYLCAYIVTNREPVSFLDGLRAFLAGELPGYMIPSHFVVVEKIPLTLNGKVDWRRLEAYALKSLNADAGNEHIPPKNETEKIIAGIWKEILGKEQVSMTDHFFNIGGNSLAIIKIAGRIKKVLGKEVPVVKLFSHTTIRSLAEYLVSGDEPASRPRLTKKRIDMQKRKNLLLDGINMFEEAFRHDANGKKEK